MIGSDGATLAGIWSQGNNPVPLSLSRFGAASPQSAPAERNSITALAVPGPPSTFAATATECPRGSMANYWDGSSWRPLRTAVMIKGGAGFSLTEAIKSPLLPTIMGQTGIMKFKGAQALLVLGSNPKFCFATAPNLSPQIMIGSLDVKSDHRQIEVTRSDSMNPEGWIPKKRMVEIDVKRISDTVIEVTPRNPLSIGQYILTPNREFSFDFGVQ